MEREERKAEYLEHFADAFAEYGIDKTSIKKLAGAAGINEASIYQYFKNKDDIIVELVKRYFDTVREEIFPILIDEKISPQLRMQRLINYRSKTDSRAKFVIQVLTNPQYSELCKPELREFLDGIREIGVKLSDQLKLSEDQAQSFVILVYSSLVADKIFNCKSILSDELEFLQSVGYHARKDLDEASALPY